MLTKFIYRSQIDLNQSINYLLTEEKKVGIKHEKHPKVFIDYVIVIH